MPRQPTRPIAFCVRSLSQTSARGYVFAGLHRWPCVLGRRGRRVLKREGDGATPIGCWALCHVLYRAERTLRPRTGLPVSPLRHQDGWCDASGDRNYNRAVRLPYPASTESLWRDDGVYDIVVVLDHNQRPHERGCGSAIFMHLIRPGRTPTAGCLALSLRDLRQILALARPGSRICVAA